MNAQNLIAKAERAVASARLLLEAGDMDGACNRAYYAMFDAARAALMASGAPAETEMARTHSGLISAFSLHLVLRQINSSGCCTEDPLSQREREG